MKINVINYAACIMDFAKGTLVKKTMGSIALLCHQYCHLENTLRHAEDSIIVFTNQQKHRC